MRFAVVLVVVLLLVLFGHLPHLVHVYLLDRGLRDGSCDLVLSVGGLPFRLRMLQICALIAYRLVVVV